MSGASSTAPGAIRLLLGRQREREALDRLLDSARGGRGGVLIVHGEAGVGKTALLEYALDAGREFRLARTVGVEGEIELAFAALQQLCFPFLELIERLPVPQRDALAVAFGLSSGPAPNPFLVGLAVLGLLAEVAKEQPLLCVVDDAQWLDEASAQCLAFVARRLLADSVVMLFAARKPGDEFAGLSQLLIEGLGETDARALLASAIVGPLDERIAEQLLAEARGNALALLELPRGLSEVELAGGFGLPGAVSLQGRIEESFAARLRTLAEDTQRLLLVAAAEPTGDVALLWRAAERLGISGPVDEPSGPARLVEIDDRVRFHHPLVRSAIYRAATTSERRLAHQALAEATDIRVDPDRRAWHLAGAAGGPDDEIATELEQAAIRARARGGLAAAAAFLERAAQLTVHPAARANRTLAAADAKQRAGAPDAATTLLVTAEAGPLDEFQHARVDLLRSHIAFALNRGRDAPELLLRAAERIAPFDLTLARETYLDALVAATFVGRLSGSVGLVEVAQAARAAPSPPQPGHAADLLLDGMALLLTEGWAASAATLRQAIAAFRSETLPHDIALRWLWPAAHAALDMWEDDSWHALAAQHVRLARESGALAVLPIALATRVGMHLGACELAEARALTAEAESVAEATGSRVAPYNAIAVAAFEGNEAETSRLIEATESEIIARGEGIGLTQSNWSNAVLYNGLGRYEDALAAAEAASEYPPDLRLYNRGLVELIEAASRSGNLARATEALEQLSESTQASGTEWALGAEARLRALLSEGDAAEGLYREAIERLGPTRVRWDLARTHLHYGEWLRRQRRGIDARKELRLAYEMFTGFGMEACAERARVELEATGERARKPTVDTLDPLTPQEAQVARLAAKGDTNREIAAQLFISPSTVEYHLRKVFRKRGVRSRTQLARQLA